VTPAYGRGDLGASLVLIFPLLLAYEIGVAFAGHVNGADVVTRALFFVLDSRALYLALHAVVALLFLVWIRPTHRWDTLRFEIVAPVVLEAAIYGLALGAAITTILHHVLSLGAADTVISALGAGVHEELVFRLGMLCGVVALLRERRFAFPLALAITSLLFAAAHHAPGGEPFTAHAFAFRTLAGAAFGAIFWFRSLAHAVYAHVLYDLAVALS